MLWMRALQKATATLKFKVVAVSVFSGVLSTLGVMHLTLGIASDELASQVLTHEGDYAESTAAMLGDKLQMLQSALKAVQERSPIDAWTSSNAMRRYLLDKPALTPLFDAITALDVSGEVLIRIEHGMPSGPAPNQGGSVLFQRAMTTDQPTVSDATVGRLSQAPVVLLAQPAVTENGAHVGLLVGSLRLRSTSLFAAANRRSTSGTREVVVDRKGKILSHPDIDQVLRAAVEVPGLEAPVKAWLDLGAPIDTQAMSFPGDKYLVSLAGIPGSDWAVIRATDQAVAQAPVAAARARGWKLALAAGGGSALLAGLLAFYVAQPLEQLRQRVERLRSAPDGDEPWPRHGGEVGQLTTAFLDLQVDRAQREAKVAQLMAQLQVVMEHAKVGLAWVQGGEFRLANAELHRVLSAPADSLPGLSMRLVHPSDDEYESFKTESANALTAQGDYEGEIELVKHDGSRFWCAIEARAIRRGDRSAGAIWTFRDVTERRQRDDALSFEASHDKLTGLHNRAAFEAELSQACTTPHVGVAALFIDLDRFKQVNDTGGHAAGDRMLQHVAELLLRSVRRDDLVARLGGDEFAVLLRNCTSESAVRVADKMRLAIERHVMPWDCHRFTIGASIGVVRTDDGQATVEAVLSSADAACYAAKRAGRNRIAVASEVTTTTAAVTVL
ncbi:diguanylate cyclase domain-containing protein [Aquincola sp. J276]|uniref:sensor domain-containing diguanylate cyclase n=1 Tax=Aquincola sp. J276 TaxID=2898432 RepID=UPI002151AA6B|nr:diguanylate cyclase [Aquincola sp. J276]MCR5864085.1 diguanylate cyclase [Aquincola sp. J276]